MHSLIEIHERPGLRAGHDIDTDKIEIIPPPEENRGIPAGAAPKTRSLANLYRRPSARRQRPGRSLRVAGPR